MKVIDPNSNNVTKENLIHYFSIPGFLDLARVEKINTEVERENQEESPFDIPRSHS